MIRNKADRVLCVNESFSWDMIGLETLQRLLEMLGTLNVHGWQAGMAGETGKTWGGGEVGMKWKCWNECGMETERTRKTGKTDS